MFGIKFTHTPKPRQFHYTPIYYDPAKEEREARRKLAEESAEDPEHYVPGSYIRAMRRRRIMGEDDPKSLQGNRLRRVVIRSVIFLFFLFLVAYALMRSNMLEAFLK